MSFPQEPDRIREPGAKQRAGLLSLEPEQLPFGPPTAIGRLPQGAGVLVIRLRSMGDTILMTPALRLLHDWRPDLKVSVLVESPWNELLERNPAIHSVIVLGGKLSTAWRLNRARFAMTINLHGGPTSAFLTWASRAPQRAGFQHFRKGLAYNLSMPTAQRILGREGPVHTAEHVASGFFWLGVPAGDIPPAQVFPSAPATDRVRARLRNMGLALQEEYAVIHPAASYASKQWKPSGFAEIGEFLLREYGLRAIYIGSRDESEVLARIEASVRHAVLRAEEWNMRKLVSLLANSRIFVGNDSGPAHLAAATGVPVLTIFGSSHSAVWGPWKAVDSMVVQNFFDCNPCPGDRCYAYDEPRCILSITTEQVKVCLESLLRSRSAARI